MRSAILRSAASLILCLALAPAARAQFELLPREPLWDRLERHAGRLSRAEIEAQLPRISPDGTLDAYLYFDGDTRLDVLDEPDGSIVLARIPLAPPVPPPTPTPPPRVLTDQDARDWGIPIEPTVRPTWDKPLLGKTICLDPGHIGGEWANLEERQFRIAAHPWVREGDLTLLTAELTAPLLEAAGATVVWTRRAPEPVTPLRPDDLTFGALLHLDLTARTKLSNLGASSLLRLVQWHQERIFYRSAEIGARAGLVRGLRPDLTLCIHYNASPWRGRPRLVNADKVVIFIHGAATPAEAADPQERFELLEKLFENSSATEIQAGAAIARQFQTVWPATGPENYDDWSVASPVAESPYLWARNLLANRVFPGPVLFVEGPYMNDRSAFYRLIEGDYEGTRTIREKEVRSIFREYAEALANGLIDHARQHLPPGVIKSG